MGMPLTKYSMLKALGYGSDSHTNSKAREVFSKYKLIGLILHDPKEHSAFHFEMTKLFDKLNYLTGDKFLFLTLVNPPRSYATIVNQSMDEENPVSPFNAYYTEDESISAFTIAHSLGIPYDDLPCVVLSPDLKANQYIYLHTDNDNIERQLQEIGYFCNGYTKNYVDFEDPMFKRLIESIDFKRSVQSKEGGFNLARILTDFLSFIVVFNREVLSRMNRQVYFDRNKEVFDNRLAHEHVLSLINDKQKNKKKDLESDVEYFENSNLSFLGQLSHINVFDRLKNGFIAEQAYYQKEIRKTNFELNPKQKSTNLSQAYSKNVLTSFDFLFKYEFESESKIILRTSKKVYELLHNEDIQLTDYTPIVIGLGKIFEKESNMSIVHWIRKKLKIELPEYFNKVKPFGACLYTPSRMVCNNPVPINFNKGYQQWIPPTMSESEITIRSLFKERKIIDLFNQKRTEILLEEWSRIRKIRNQAAHEDIINNSHLVQIMKSYKTLSDSDILNKMVRIKKRYMGLEVRHFFFRF